MRKWLAHPIISAVADPELGVVVLHQLYGIIAGGKKREHADVKLLLGA